jgi:hypothetical protein
VNLTVEKILLAIRSMVIVKSGSDSINTLNVRLESRFKREVSKGVWGMPRLSEAKKDVISCEKLRGSANSY